VTNLVVTVTTSPSLPIDKKETMFAAASSPRVSFSAHRLVARWATPTPIPNGIRVGNVTAYESAFIFFSGTIYHQPTRFCLTVSAAAPGIAPTKKLFCQTTY
jgi:hypothetical protein